MTYSIYSSSYFPLIISKIDKNHIRASMFQGLPSEHKSHHIISIPFYPPKMFIGFF